MAAPSAALSNAQRALVEELDARESAARSAWTAAQERTAAAIAEEQAAFAVLSAASATSRAMKDALSRICGGLNAPVSSESAGKPNAASLTADVLAEIFKFTADSYDFDEENPSTPLPHCPAFRVASVSRHWRSIAIATAALWSKVYLRFTVKTCTHLKAHIDTILSRTRRELLDIVLLDSPSATRWSMFTQAEEHALVSAFARSTRIRIHFDSLNIVFKDSLMPLLQAHMPHLKTFAFLVGSNDPSPVFDGVPASVRLLSLCPNLRDLDIQKLPFAHISPKSMPLLESFKLLGTLSGGQALAICRAWPKLRSLDVRAVVDIPPNGAAASTDKSNNLETLVCYAGGSNIFRVFTSVHLPALRELALDCGAPRDQRNLDSFLRPGPCVSLRKLTLRGSFVMGSLDNLLSMPNLATLCFSELARESVRALFNLWCSADRVAHPPRLLNLHLDNCEFGQNASHALLEFLEERGRAQTDDVTAISELLVVQDEAYGTREDLFEPWMAARVQQLVERVTIDISGAYIMD